MSLPKKPVARFCAASIVLAASTSVSYAGAPSLMNASIAAPSAPIVQAQYCCGGGGGEVASVTEFRPVVHWRARTVWRPTTVWRPVRSYQPVRSWRPVTHHYYYAPVYYAPTYYAPANPCCYSGYSGY